MVKEVGKTKDAGFQIGVRKTMGNSVTEMWDFMFSSKGLTIWLGIVNPNEFEIGKEITLPDGTEVKITVFKPYSHIRMNWRKSEWINHSRLQVRVIDSKGKSTISFHQELLRDSTQREKMKSHWKKVMEKISSEID